ncbi:3-hydroxyisobutyrate dehydrogenase [Corynebacterium halotolerans]|uniref:3-hydroxyisobutyrate dehydrogenase n=1 Tax=Corynebacterium halotolerans TaxID=225326 RepID=UPI003CF35971
MSNIGWVGLGNMGSHMAANLVQAGHTVKGFDLNPAALNQAIESGVTATASVAETVQDVDVVFTMLPKGEHVRNVFDGPEGIWANASQKTLLVDSSTVDIDSARFLHDKSQELGFDFVDAPVSGGISGAEAGTLAFMLGGSSINTSRAESYIEPMARKIFVAGGPTMGIAAKIANNMMLFINVLANSEGSQLAEQLGLDPKVFWEIVTASSGQSWAQQTWYPMPDIIDVSPANRNFDPGFATELARKDVGLALDAGAAAGISLPAANLAREQFDRLIEEGMATKDCTLIAKYVNPTGDVRGWNNVDGNVSNEDAA